MDINCLSISPNGDSIVFPDNGCIKILDLITLSSKILTSHIKGSHHYPVFSPEGQHIYFTSTYLSRCSILKLNIQSGQSEIVQEYSEDGIIRHLKLNESGRNVYYSANLTSGDYVCSLNLSTLGIKQHGKGLVYPSGFSIQKSGTLLAYIIDGDVVILDEGDEKVLRTGMSTELHETSIQLLDDGIHVIVSDNQEPYSDMYIHNLSTRDVSYVGNGSWPCYHSRIKRLFYYENGIKSVCLRQGAYL